MSGGIDIFGMVSGLGKSFGASYAAAKKEALASDLGEKVRTGDYAGAADVALKGGDLQTGLALVKLGESRGANKQLADTLAPLFGGAGGGSDAQTGTLGTLTETYRGSGGNPPAGRLPAFAGGDAAMRVPGSGGEIETRFVNALKAGGLTNPAGLAAMAAYAGHESGYSPRNIAGSWSDPSESGQPGTSGGILSWRGDRFANMRRLTAGAADPVTAQAQFALTESPALTLALQNAKSAEEANSLMANAWKFAGYNRPGGEAAARLASTRSYLGRLGGAPAEPVAVASAAGAIPDAANRPAEGAQQAQFFVPPGPGRPGGRGAPTLGRPGASDGTVPGTGAVEPAAGITADEAGAVPGPALAPVVPGPTQVSPTSGGATPTMTQLAGAGVPRQAVVAIGRMAPGSPERVQALLRASMIPGLSEQGQGLVKTLLAHEMEQGKPTSDQRDYDLARSQGFRGTFLDYKTALRGDKSRTQVVQSEDGQRYVVDPDNADAEPRLLNIPRAGVRVWGETGPDGQIIRSPAGVPEGTPGYYDAKGVPQLITGKGVSVKVDTKGASKFTEKANEFQAKRYGEIVEAADNAVPLRGDIETMADLGSQIATGRLAEARLGLAQYAKAVGADSIANSLTNDKMGAMEAYSALADKIVPRMRVPGSGATSDMEGRAFKNSLPSLLKSAEGNAIIVDTFRGLLDHQTEAGEIAGKALRGEIGQGEADQAIRALPNPYARFKEHRGKASGDTGVAAAAPARTDAAGSPPPRFTSSTSIRMEDAQALKAAADTAENRAIFDSRYGEGAARFVLRRPAPQGAEQSGEQAPAAAQPVSGLTITSRDANALRSAPDTAETRAEFDRRYGEGAAMRVLRRPLPAPDGAAPQGQRSLPKGADRVPLPDGYSAAQAVSEARAAVAAGRDRAAIAERLWSHGIDPARLDR